MPVLCCVWQPVPQHAVPEHSQPSVSGAVAELQSNLPVLQVYVHVEPVLHDGVPVLVLQTLPHALQFVVELSCVSQPLLSGAVALQSPQPDAHPPYVQVGVEPEQVVVPVACVESQVTPHAPQLVVVVSLTQVPPQRICPVGHLHAPAWHVDPPVHAFPQAPQLLSSFCSLTQAPLHAVKPVLHANVHARLTHAGVAFATLVVHTLPHAPHWSTVLTCVSQPSRSGAALLQSAHPAAQPLYEHVVPLQLAPLLWTVSQALPQPAQFDTDVSGLSQPSESGDVLLQSA
jgi:hypothetical protein